MQSLNKMPYSLWQPACWLRVTGEDALTFLQGQLTNNLQKLMRGETVYGLWLNQKGKVVADSFVIRSGEEEFLVGSYVSDATVIRERLEAYIIADDVTITDETAAWVGVTLFTEIGREALMAALPEGVVFAGRRSSEAHWEWVGKNEARVKLLASLADSPVLSAGQMAARRIAAAIPLIPQDIGAGDLPNEGGLDCDAVSYTKGCYLGQEVMARLKAMGRVRRRLLRVEGMGGIPVLPAPLFTGDRQVGELRSAVAHENGFVGLAMITLMHAPADKQLALQPGDSGMITLHDSP